jgi:curved DNA-binding protein CbpA
MKTPFEILNIPLEATDEDVREGYLRLVRQYPPERFPMEFQRIRAAFEKIKTTKARLHCAIFDRSMPDAELLAADIRAKAAPGRPAEKQLRELLAASILNTKSAGEPPHG